MRSAVEGVESVILDACCCLNLAASSQVEAILCQLPYRFVIGARARAEALFLHTPATGEKELVDLQPLLDSGLLVVESLQEPQEEADFLGLSTAIDDGEAEAAVLAANRGYVLATDDHKARRIVTERWPDLRLSSTLEILHEWQVTATIANGPVADALRRISERARYRPGRQHPLWEWWQTLVEEGTSR